MKTRDLKSLSETIASVVDPIDKERAQMLQEGFLNSLTEKARQIASKEMEDEGEEEEDEDEMEDEGEEEEKPTSKKKKAKMDEAYPTTYVPEPKPVKPEPKPVKPKKKLSDYRSKPYPKLTNEEVELAEKARQVVSEAVETKTEDEVEAIMKRLAAQALKKAKKKARASRASTDDAYAGINPSAAKTDPDMKNTGAVAEELIYEVAAPGYEDWASDPKVKASFKKQYGKRWKEVMYGHSWNLAKQEDKLGLDEEEQLDELTDALISRARNKAILRGPEKRGFVKKATKRLQSSGAMAPRPSTSTERDSQWNKAFNEETDLDEAVSAKRMRIIRKYVKGNKRVPEHLKDYMERSFKKKRLKDKQLSDGRGAVGALETRMRRKSAALRARGIEPKGVAPGYLEEEWGGGFQSSQDAQREVQAGLRRDAAMERKTKIADIKAVLAGRMSKNAFTKKHRTKFSEHPLTKKIVAAREKAKARRLAESMQLDEAGYKRLMRLKKAAYEAGQKGSPSHGRKMRAAAERESQVAAGMARRGGASPDAVRGGGSRIGKSGKYTQKAGALANQRDKALQSFRTKVRTAELFGRETDKRAKRERQQAQAKFANKARSGDFGQDNQAALRARSNFQKRYGRLKGK